MSKPKWTVEERRQRMSDGYHEKHLVGMRVDGCPEVVAHCLECPLSACRYDDPGPYHAWQRAKERVNGAV